MESRPECMEANPKEMQFEEEHQEVPKEHAAVNSSEALKRHRDRNLAAESCRKPKNGSQRKLTAARSGKPICRSGTVQGTRQAESDYRRGMRHCKKTDVREEASAKTGMQKWN